MNVKVLAAGAAILAINLPSLCGADAQFLQMAQLGSGSLLESSRPSKVSPQSGVGQSRPSGSSLDIGRGLDMGKGLNTGRGMETSPRQPQGRLPASPSLEKGFEFGVGVGGDRGRTRIGR